MRAGLSYLFKIKEERSILWLQFTKGLRDKDFLHCTLPSAKAEMTFPRADRDLLMFLASSNTAPSAPVLLT